MVERLQAVHIGRLIFGVIFIILGIYGTTDADLSPAWVWVAVLSATGVAGLATAARIFVGER